MKSTEDLLEENARLRRENEALTKLYVVAARLRQFPVPFYDHFALVGAADECRTIVEPPVTPAGSRSIPNGHVAAYSREEFLATFREAHTTLHRLWTDAVGKPDYNKPLWRLLDNALGRFARDAAEKIGIARSEPLL